MHWRKFVRFRNKAENMTSDTAALHSHRDHSGSRLLVTLGDFTFERGRGKTPLVCSAKIPPDQFRPWEFLPSYSHKKPPPRSPSEVLKCVLIPAAAAGVVLTGSQRSSSQLGSVGLSNIENEYGSLFHLHFCTTHIEDPKMNDTKGWGVWSPVLGHLNWTIWSPRAKFRLIRY